MSTDAVAVLQYFVQILRCKAHVFALAAPYHPTSHFKNVGVVCGKLQDPYWLCGWDTSCHDSPAHSF